MRNSNFDIYDEVAVESKRAAQGTVWPCIYNSNGTTTLFGITVDTAEYRASEEMSAYKSITQIMTGSYDEVRDDLIKTMECFTTISDEDRTNLIAYGEFCIKFTQARKDIPLKDIHKVFAPFRSDFERAFN
jgi:hypothetical protein